MGNMKLYLAIFLIRVLYTGLQIFSKAALNEGMSTYVFVFYRQVFALTFLLPVAFIFERKRAPPLSLLVFLKMFVLALIGITATLNLFAIAIDYTSASLASTIFNSIPVCTFILALLLRMEAVKLRKSSGIAKVFGVALCSGGILMIAFYKGLPLYPLNHHHPLGHSSSHANEFQASSNKKWILGSFIMVLSTITFSLWLVLQRPLLDEYPSKLLFTTLQTFFSAIQSFFVALSFERDLSRWKLRINMGLVAVLYTGIFVTGVSYYLQAWCIEKRGPVFLTATTPLSLIMTMITSSFLIGEVINFGSVIGAVLMVGGLYCVLWGKTKERKDSKLLTVEDG